jgi:hypothetical protein
MRGVIFSGLLASGALLAGCASTHPADIAEVEKPYQEKTRVQWNSSNLPAVLAIDKASADRTEAGLLCVQLAIRNKTRKDLFVDIRTLFTDGKGFEVEKTNWEPICCTARTVTTYKTVSLGKQVQDYQVIIRDPRKPEPMP